jgi:hypothetical protein
VITGTCIVAETPAYTQYHWGPLSDIAGQTLKVLERNPQGDCLALLEGKGLVDVDNRDVAEFQAAETSAHMGPFGATDTDITAVAAALLGSMLGDAAKVSDFMVRSARQVARQASW